jgi:predicted kinase
MATIMDQTIRKGSMPPRGVFIQMSGAPGSGKSTMAKLLRQSIGGVVIDHDIIRSSLLEDNDLPFDEVAKKAYRIQWAFAEAMAQQGFNIIMDSTCNFQEVLDWGSAVAEQHGLAYWYVECKVEDIDLLDERLRTRAPLKSQRAGVERPPEAASGARKGEDSRAQFRKWIDAPCRPERNVIIVDSACDLETGRHNILKHILPDIGVKTIDACVIFLLLGYPKPYCLISRQIEHNCLGYIRRVFLVFTQGYAITTSIIWYICSLISSTGSRTLLSSQPGMDISTFGDSE